MNEQMNERTNDMNDSSCQTDRLELNLDICHTVYLQLIYRNPVKKISEGFCCRNQEDADHRVENIYVIATLLYGRLVQPKQSASTGSDER